MAYVHSKRGEAFKFCFVCMTFLMGDGKLRRAAIIGVSELPGDPNHYQAVVIFEGDNMPCVPKVIPRADYEKALFNQDIINAVESPYERGRLALMGPGGQAISNG